MERKSTRQTLQGTLKRIKRALLWTAKINKYQIYKMTNIATTNVIIGSNLTVNELITAESANITTTLTAELVTATNININNNLEVDTINSNNIISNIITYTTLTGTSSSTIWIGDQLELQNSTGEIIVTPQEINFSISSPIVTFSMGNSDGIFYLYNDNTSSNVLTVDYTDNTVQILNSLSVDTLNVDTDIYVNTLTVNSLLTSDNITVNSLLTSDNITVNSLLTSDNITVNSLTADNITVTNTLTSDNITVTNTLTSDNITVTNTLTSDNLTVNNQLNTNNLSITGLFSMTGNFITSIGSVETLSTNNFLAFQIANTTYYKEVFVIANNLTVGTNQVANVFFSYTFSTTLSIVYSNLPGFEITGNQLAIAVEPSTLTTYTGFLIVAGF